MSQTRYEIRKKYNDEHYEQITFHLKKDLVRNFKRKCKENGITQSSIIREAIESFLEED
ncbi:MAG: ribbon-helix-helix domain-containing protein [Clostridiales bacterium]|nr:ribbon-helix-helix domain-containing protein [Clostridiales bacterium]